MLRCAFTSSGGVWVSHSDNDSSLIEAPPEHLQEDQVCFTGFRMAICLDEFQQISQFNGGSVENAIRNQVQEQREVGYVFAGSQPSLMQEMLSAKRPFHKAGPQVFLDKIPAAFFPALDEAAKRVPSADSGNPSCRRFRASDEHNVPEAVGVKPCHRVQILRQHLTFS
jgi:hypothetical protein